MSKNVKVNQQNLVNGLRKTIPSINNALLGLVFDMKYRNFFLYLVVSLLKDIFLSIPGQSIQNPFQK